MPSFNGLLSYGIEPLWLIVVLHSMCCEEALFALQQRHFRGICSSSHLHRITKTNSTKRPAPCPRSTQEETLQDATAVAAPDAQHPSLNDCDARTCCGGYFKLKIHYARRLLR